MSLWREAAEAHVPLKLYKQKRYIKVWQAEKHTLIWRPQNTDYRTVWISCVFKQDKFDKRRVCWFALALAAVCVIGQNDIKPQEDPEPRVFTDSHCVLLGGGVCVCVFYSFQKDHSGKRAVTREVRVGVSSLFSMDRREKQIVCVCVCVCVQVYISWWGLKPEYTQTHGDSCHSGDQNWGPHGYKSF